MSGAGGRTIASRPLLWVYLFGAAATWGSTFLLMKITVAEVPPFTMAALRAALAALALATWFAASGRAMGLNRSEAWHAAILGTTNGWLPTALTALAVAHIDSALAAMILAATPLMVVLLAHFTIGDEPLTARRFAGVVVGMAGVFLIVGPDAVLGAAATVTGGLCMLGVALSYALGTIHMRRLRHADPIRFTLGQQAFSALPAAAVALAFEPASAWTPSAGTWAVLILLGVGATALPMVLYMRVVAGAGATLGSMIGYLQPAWATLLGVTVLGERIAIHAAFGCVVVLAGVWIVTARRG